LVATDPVPRIAITTGEPAGIGPDLCLQLATANRLPAELVFIGDFDLLAERAARLKLKLDFHLFDSAASAEPQCPGRFIVLPHSLVQPSRCGQLDPANAPYVLQLLDSAIDSCLAGQFQAMVTAPVQKSVINDAGIRFSGHTEYLAHRCGVAQVVMMLVSGGLRVALATTHLPLREVAEAVTPELLRAVLQIVHQSLQQTLRRPPVVLVCGLNPHAGEGGHLGREEIEIIEPVIEELVAAGLQLQGPVPADTAFLPERLAGVDVVLALYHDQGLPVLKARGFGAAVNVTLGLPFVRTSVDHGTALALAGSGSASFGSLECALKVALEQA